MPRVLTDPQIETVFGRLRQFFPFMADTPELRQFVGSRLDIGETPDIIAQNILQTPERTGEFTLGAQRQAQLELAPQLESIGLEEQGATRAAELAKTRLGGFRTQLEEDIADAIKRVNKQREEEEKRFLGQQSERGLFRSGLTQEGLQRLGLETTETLNRLEKQRANKLAELALQATGVEQTLASSVRQAQLEKTRLQAGLGQRATELFGLGRQAVERGQAGELERALQFEELARQTPEGEIIELPGGQRVTGKKKKIVDIDAFNRIVSNPGTINLPDNILQQLLEGIGFTVTA